MNIIYLLLPVALILLAIIIWLFMWAIKSDQFEDLEGPAYQILMDDNERESVSETDNAHTTDALPPDESNVKHQD